MVAGKIENWKVTTSEMMLTGVMPEIVLAGACNLIAPDGSTVRNTGRDGIGEWLSEREISFFEVQIHPDTHAGRGYDYTLDGPAEKKARRGAKIRVYEIRPEAISGVTFLEILDDKANGRTSIVWFNGAGFEPEGLGNRKAIKANEELKNRVGPLIHAHLEAYANSGGQMRAELQQFIEDAPTITVVTGDEDAVKAAISYLLAEANVPG